MSRRRAAGVALALCIGVAPADSQPAPPARPAHAAHVGATPLDSAPFLVRARAASAAYRDRASAIADGFRPLGPDFPGMAQHWISVSRLMRGGFDAAAPAVLTYAEVGGAPVLLGVAWTVVLSPGELPPPAPVGAQWHEHVETIDEESAMLHELAEGAGLTRSRLAMLHAWLWLENPDGVFASDNWAVPFRRAGLAARASSAPAQRDAARALSLLGEGTRYWADVARVRARLAAEERAPVAARLGAAAAEVGRLVGARDGRTLAPSELAALAVAWRTAWEDASATLPPERRAALRAIAR